MSPVNIVTGCARAGKTEQLLDHYCVALERARLDQQPGATLWLCPTRRVQQEILQQIQRKQGNACFAPNVLTFDLFAEKILEAAGRPASPISPVIKRLLLRRICENLTKQGELRHFLPIAETTGFLDIVSSFISELKREEIWPEAFVEACQDRNAAFARRELELGLIYQQYQFRLAEQNWYDNEGRFWLARKAMEEGVRGVFASVRTLVVDGFTDFTQPQYGILGYLAGWINDFSIVLPIDRSGRTDLFGKPAAAISRIREKLPSGRSLQVNQVQSNTPTPAAIRTIADSLFSNPRFVRSSSSTQGLQIIESMGQFAEWEAIARRIKSMLGGMGPHEKNCRTNTSSSALIRPQDIFIGIRSIEDEGPSLCEFLRLAGLPVWCEAVSPLTSSNMVRSILSLIQLELEDWPFERLLSILDSNFFRPDWPEMNSARSIRSAAAFLRRANIESGRLTMLRAFERYSHLGDTDLVNDSLASLARQALPLVNRLSRSLEGCRRTHTLQDWADVLAVVTEDLGWIKQSANDEISKNEILDYDLLQRILRTAAEADQKLAGQAKPARLNLGEFAAELRDLLSHETVKPEPYSGGSIRILSVEQIRNLDVPHLILTGLTESSFPMHRADDCLFSESERRAFNEQGVALKHRTSHQADEMLLFYNVVTRARQSLTLSYSKVNSKGQQVFPSPYVAALISLFDRDALAISREGQLDPVPKPECALSGTDLRIAAMDSARQGQPKLFRAVLEIESLRSSAWNTLAACDVAGHRFHQRGFTAFEGRLEIEQNLNGLQSRFGTRHQFSATELESYARCPFQFWLSNILKIGAIESPEEGTDYAARGTLIHEVLARLLIEGKFSDPVALKLRFVELVESELKRHVPETELQRALIDVERMIMDEWSDAFVKQQSEYDQRIGEKLYRIQSLAPEIPFGRLPDSPTDLATAYPAIQFGQGDRVVNLRGRIDRVDVGLSDGKPAYIVIDYKTGQRPSLKNHDLISGRSIQLALYLLAVKKLGLVSSDAIPFQMGFWALRELGFKPGTGKSTLEAIDESYVRSLELLLDDLLPRLANQIRTGRFIVENEDESCTGRCPYRTVCRVNQIRPLAESLGKQSPAPIDLMSVPVRNE